jgi:hypothetical protein
MGFLQRIPVVAAVAMAMVVSTGVATAHGSNGDGMDPIDPAAHNYNGNWPVTITHTTHGSFSGCLTLTGSGSNGGLATLVLGSQKFPYGTFQIFNHTLVATIQAQGYGQNAGLVFIGSAGRRSIGPGVFDEVYGGGAFLEGALGFGMKGGC